MMRAREAAVGKLSKLSELAEGLDGFVQQAAVDSTAAHVVDTWSLAV